jgi:hypothetical protein
VASEDTDRTGAPGSEPVRHAAPSRQPAPAPTPAPGSEPVRHAAPSWQPAPAQRSEPVRHAAPSRQPAPAPTPAQRSDPGARAWERVRASTASPPTRGTSTAIPGQSLPDSPVGVDLAEAIEMLCHTLERAWRDTQQHGMRFEVEPVEITLHVGVARTGQGSAGIEWRMLRFDDHMLPQTGTAQTLTIRFAPRLADGGPTLAKPDKPVPHREDAAAKPSLSVDGPKDSDM